MPSAPTTIIGQVPTVVTACQVAATQGQPIAIGTPGMPNVIQAQTGAQLPKGRSLYLLQGWQKWLNSFFQVNLLDFVYAVHPPLSFSVDAHSLTLGELQKNVGLL